MQGRFDEAIVAHRSVLERARVDPGEAHRKTLLWFGNYADTLAEDGRVAEAEAVHREALEISRRANGPSGIRTLQQTARLAEFLTSTDGFAEAGELADLGGR